MTEITSYVTAEVHYPERFIGSYALACYVAVVVPNTASITVCSKDDDNGEGSMKTDRRMIPPRQVCCATIVRDCNVHLQRWSSAR
jgi:hypothetical protein